MSTDNFHDEFIAQSTAADISNFTDWVRTKLKESERAMSIEENTWLIEILFEAYRQGINDALRLQLELHTQEFQKLG